MFQCLQICYGKLLIGILTGIGSVRDNDHGGNLRGDFSRLSPQQVHVIIVSQE